MENITKCYRLLEEKANLGQVVLKIQFPYDKSNVKSDISRVTEREWHGD